MIKCLNYLVNVLVLLPILVGVLVSLVFLGVSATWCNSNYYEPPEPIQNLRRYLKTYVNLLF